MDKTLATRWSIFSDRRSYNPNKTDYLIYVQFINAVSSVLSNKQPFYSTLKIRT